MNRDEVCVPLPERTLADALEDLAREIVLIEPEPMDWGGWVMYGVLKEM